MCTAAAFQTKDFYFGRTLDYECSYGECVTVTPRRYPFSFRHMGRLDAHYAMIGMAHVADGYPLYYDAVNEAGLGMAGLNFVGNAQYAEVREGTENIAQFERGDVRPNEVCYRCTERGKDSCKKVQGKRCF